MKPTVGRIVHYVSYGTPGGEFKSRCVAAVITDVQVIQSPIDGAGVNMCRLCVLNPSGIFFTDFLEERDPSTAEKSKGGTWHWPERDEA